MTKHICSLESSRILVTSSCLKDNALSKNTISRTEVEPLERASFCCDVSGFMWRSPLVLTQVCGCAASLVQLLPGSGVAATSQCQLRSVCRSLWCMYYFSDLEDGVKKPTGEKLLAQTVLLASQESMCLDAETNTTFTFGFIFQNK